MFATGCQLDASRQFLGTHVKSLKTFAHIHTTFPHSFEEIRALPVEAQAIPLALRIGLAHLKRRDAVQDGPNASRQSWVNVHCQ